MSVLVIAEHDNAAYKSATLNTVTAAQELGGDIEVLVAGESCGAVGEAVAKIDGVSKVLVADNALYANRLAENMALLLADIGKNYSHIIMAATSTGKDVLPRAAALLDVAQISEIIKIESADTFVRAIYAGNAIETVKSADAVKVITVRPTGFGAAAAEGGSASVEAVTAAHDAGLSEFVKEELAQSDRPELTSAGVVVAGGRGLQNSEKFEILYSLADKLGGAVGATRAAVDAGFCANDLQIGQTGKVIAPDLYFAFGISGAIQHLAGVTDSKVIVCVNKDEDAPMFQVSDYGLVGDLFEVIPELVEKL